MTQDETTGSAPSTTPKPKEIPLQAVVSSQIEAIGYDDETQTLAVRFKAGPGSRLYHYTGFPPGEWSAFSSAASPGSHFFKAIKGKYTFARQ